MNKNKPASPIVLLSVTIAALATNGSNAYASELGFQIYKRIAGGTPPISTRGTIDELGGSGDIDGVVDQAMSTEEFYYNTLFNMFAPAFNEGKQTDILANDGLMTTLNVIATDADFRRLFYDDIQAVANSNQVTAPVAATNNTHYEQADALRLDVATGYQLQSQKAINNLTTPAGIFTLRSSGEVIWKDGTNRRVLAWFTENFFCQDLKTMKDTSIPDVFVRKDVDRLDSNKYQTECRGCHAGMDGIVNAFNLVDWDNRTRAVIENTQVPAKMLRNFDRYPVGYQPVGTDYTNLWVNGLNSQVGWRTGGNTGLSSRDASTGTGPAMMGKVLANTRRLSECMAKKVLNVVCIRPMSSEEKETVKIVADAFESSGYKFKSMFHAAAHTQGCFLQ